MKNTKKIFSCFFWGGVIALCLCFLTLTFNNRVVNAETNITSENFKLIDGASIRTGTPKGLRFELNVSNALKENLGETNVTYGVLVTLDTLLDSNALTKDSNVKCLNIEGKNWLAADKVYSGNEYSGFYATLVGGSGNDVSNLVDFSEEYYSEVFVARGYITVDGVVVGYTNTVERTLAGTAIMSYEIADEVQQEFIDQILSSDYIEKCILTYDLGNGSTIPSEQLIKGVVVDDYKPEDPERTGYTFKGWQYADGTPAFNGEIIKKDVTIYAVWEEIEYVTESGSIISSINSSVDPYTKIDDFTGPTYDGDVYEFSNGGRSNYNHRKILQIDKSKFGDLFAVGNYILIDVYSKAELKVVASGGGTVDLAQPKLTSGGTVSGGSYAGAYKQYKLVDGKYVYQSLDLNTGDSWSVMALKITNTSGNTDAMSDMYINFYAGPASGTGGVYFGNVTVCSADYFESRLLSVVTMSGSAISTLNQSADPYVKVDFTGPTYDGDVYEFSNGGRSNYNHRKILQIDKSKFGDLFAVGNYILIDVYSNADLKVVTSGGGTVDPAQPKLTSGGTSSGGSYAGAYKQYKLVDGKYVYQSLDLNTGNSWSVMALKITNTSGSSTALSDIFINFYAGPAQNAEGVYFGNVTVCSADYFESKLANN